MAAAHALDVAKYCRTTATTAGTCSPAQWPGSLRDTSRSAQKRGRRGICTDTTTPIQRQRQASNLNPVWTDTWTEKHLEHNNGCSQATGTLFEPTLVRILQRSPWRLEDINGCSHGPATLPATSLTPRQLASGRQRRHRGTGCLSRAAARSSALRERRGPGAGKKRRREALPGLGNKRKDGEEARQQGCHRDAGCLVPMFLLPLFAFSLLAAADSIVKPPARSNSPSIRSPYPYFLLPVVASLPSPLFRSPGRYDGRRLMRLLRGEDPHRHRSLGGLSPMTRTLGRSDY